MSILYLLDTNIFVHYVRSSTVWTNLQNQYQLFSLLPCPLLSVVTEGELRSLALRWSWGPNKINLLDYCLQFFEKRTIDNPAVIDAYARIDAYCESIGVSMGKNDLWIAATATATGATLLTADRDFDHLVPLFLARDWIDPNTP